MPSIRWLRLADVPLFILTADYTFSAAEAFAYDLKALGRASIVGETTGGGAHLQNFFRVTETMTISISWGRAVNPLTGGNWEGVGVQPHINCSADDALEVAHGKAKEAAEKRRAHRRRGLEAQRALARRVAQEAFEAMQQGRAEDAIEILTSIVAANPEDKNALARLVAMYHAVGDMKEIEATLERALDIGAGDEGEFNHLGYSYVRMGNTALAIAVFAFNTKAFPESYNAWDSLGEAYMKVGNHEEAARRYEKSLELNPNNTNALKMLERLRS